VLPCVAVCHKAHTNSDACPLISISRLLQIIGLFCKRDLYYRSLLQKRPNSDAGPLIWSPQAAVRSHNGMRLSVLGELFRNACRNNPPNTHTTHQSRRTRLCCAASRRYWVASLSRIDQIIGLFCKRALQKRRFSAKDFSYVALHTPMVRRVSA